MKFIKLIVLVGMMLPMLSSCNYNSLVEKKQNVEQSWAEVQNQYQRRADLIPNLVPLSRATPLTRARLLKR